MTSIIYFNPVELIRDFRIRLNNNQPPHRELSNSIRGQILSQKFTLLYPTDPTSASRFFFLTGPINIVAFIAKVELKYLSQWGRTSNLPVSNITLRNLWMIAFKDTLI